VCGLTNASSKKWQGESDRVMQLRCIDVVVSIIQRDRKPMAGRVQVVPVGGRNHDVLKSRHLITQFHPNEFSAIIGALISCVLAEFPVRPLPRLFRSCEPSGTLETLPPDMKAPPISAGLPDCRISDGSVSELDLLWLCLRFLYRRAIRNMAAPYAADPPIAAMAIPAVVPLTVDEVLCDCVLKTPLSPEAALEEAALPLPVAVDPPPMVDPTVRGMAELM